MRILIFLLALLGLSALTSILLLQKPIEITSQENLSSLLPNTKVSFSGEVLSERIYKYDKEIFLSNNLSFQTEKTPERLTNKKVEVEAKVEEYKGENYLQATKLTIQK